MRREEPFFGRMPRERGTRCAEGSPLLMSVTRMSVTRMSVTRVSLTFSSASRCTSACTSVPAHRAACYGRVGSTPWYTREEGGCIYQEGVPPTIPRGCIYTEVPTHHGRHSSLLTRYPSPWEA